MDDGRVPASYLPFRLARLFNRSLGTGYRPEEIAEWPADYVDLALGFLGVQRDYDLWQRSCYTWGN